ncbi:hypothetical protein, partial [Methanoculleus chikugoensis]|uniref:hypothetical protein n=1 Tax=Methanoculleus chikugoensis TaxID=118126 RepID=UPI001FB45D87
MMEGEAPGTDRRRIAAVSVGIGFLAGGAAVLGVVEALSRCWSAASAYNQGLLGGVGGSRRPSSRFCWSSSS